MIRFAELSESELSLLYFKKVAENTKTIVALILWLFERKKFSATALGKFYPKTKRQEENYDTRVIG